MRTRACTLVVLLAASLGGAARGETVIAPGQEPLLGEMLGGSDALPGGCKLDEASVQKSRVDATYRCGDQRAVKLSLVHPDEAPRGATRTAQFAIVPDPSAPPPAPLVAAVADRVRARESGWKWKVAVSGRPDPGAAVPAGSAPANGSQPEPSQDVHAPAASPRALGRAVLAAALLALALSSAAAVRARRRRARAPQGTDRAPPAA